MGNGSLSTGLQHMLCYFERARSLHGPSLPEAIIQLGYIYLQVAGKLLF
jgi:hypothetical protein